MNGLLDPCASPTLRLTANNKHLAMGCLEKRNRSSESGTARRLFLAPFAALRFEMKSNRKIVRVGLLLLCTCGMRPPASEGKCIETLEG